jgi:hypothetical protein
MTVEPSAAPASSERHDDLVQEVGGLLLDAAPADFRRIDVAVRMTVTVHELVMTVYRADGSAAQVRPPEGLAAMFGELRRVANRPGRGTWRSARCTVEAPGQIDISYNLDHEPRGAVPIPAEGLAAELAAFPRETLVEPATADHDILLGSVTTLLVERLPGDWQELTLDLRVVGGHHAARAAVRTIFGRTGPWELPPEAFPLFQRLRHGTWRSLSYRLTHPDRYAVEFDRPAQ